MPTQTRNMITLALFGAIAGLTFYGLLEWTEALENFERLLFGAFVFSICLFGGSLAMAGPVALNRCLLPTAGFGIALTGLILWGSLRFEDVSDFMYTGHPPALIFVMFVIGIPFLITWAVPGKSPTKYGDLFDAAWGAVTRVIVSMAFTW